MNHSYDFKEDLLVLFGPHLCRWLGLRHVQEHKSIDCQGADVLPHNPRPVETAEMIESRLARRIDDVATLTKLDWFISILTLELIYNFNQI